MYLGYRANNQPTMPLVSAQADTSAPSTGKVQAPTSISVVAWVPNRDIDFPEWAEAGRRLGAMGRCGQWGLGDWIQYGNAKFGERYRRAARITGYDVQTLMNIVYVASKFEISRRRENLSWSHHETVAPLEPDEQDHWLDLATSRKLSVSDLRLELRSTRRAHRSTVANQRGQEISDRETTSEGTGVLICPNCGEVVPVPSRIEK
jgi:hypothetical protein